MVGCAIRGYINTALRIFEDKVNTENIDIVLSEFKDFCTNKERGVFDEKELGVNTRKIYEKLLKIKAS